MFIQEKDLKESIAITNPVLSNFPNVKEWVSLWFTSERKKSEHLIDPKLNIRKDPKKKRNGYHRSTEKVMPRFQASKQRW